jgi:phospholipase/carboxylesterase
MALQIATMTKNYEALAASHPPGLDEATQQLDEAILALESEVDAQNHALYIGGFSQGAMLSCNWALERHRPIAGLIQLSGTVLRENAWKAALEQRKGLPVFQSHSPEDQVLPYALATKLKGMFESAETAHSWVSFKGGHGIGPEVLNQLGRFLSRSS